MTIGVILIIAYICLLESNGQGSETYLNDLHLFSCLFLLLGNDPVGYLNFSQEYQVHIHHRRTMQGYNIIKTMV